ncbi:BMC domain-containing protein [Clostridium sp.]|uniref:BMC domain-containing protein n=1 Tax=Clostridium sp. TaxID=1506 RepID=UPI0032171F7B
MYRGALGLIEVYGYLGAIEAADIALKAANVNLVGCEKVKGGLVTVKIKGDVSAVKAAVEAAEVAVAKLNVLVGTHVISRPDLSVWDIVEESIDNNKTCKDKENNEDLSVVKREKTDDEPKEPKNVNQEEKIQEPEEIKLEEHILENSESLKDQLESKKVDELRTLARSLNLDNMTRKQIKFAKKDNLIEEIILFYQRRDK